MVFWATRAAARGSDHLPRGSQHLPRAGFEGFNGAPGATQGRAPRVRVGLALLPCLLEWCSPGLRCRARAGHWLAGSLEWFGRGRVAPREKGPWRDGPHADPHRLCEGRRVSGSPRPLLASEVGRFGSSVCVWDPWLGQRSVIIRNYSAATRPVM